MYWRFDLKIIEQFIEKKNEKEEFSPSLQVGVSIVDLKLKELS
jgi:hypothetical protein